MLLTIGAPAIASAQNARSRHVIVATVERLPDDGTVAVLKRFADPAHKDVIFLDSRGEDKALKFALSALRHLRFSSPNPEQDVTVALHAAKSASASTPADNPENKKLGKTINAALAALDAKNANGTTRELPDAFLH
jgi:hypothetical protein